MVSEVTLIFLAIYQLSFFNISVENKLEEPRLNWYIKSNSQLFSAQNLQPLLTCTCWSRTLNKNSEKMSFASQTEFASHWNFHWNRHRFFYQLFPYVAFLMEGGVAGFFSWYFFVLGNYPRSGFLLFFQQENNM